MSENYQKSFNIAMKLKELYKNGRKRLRKHSLTLNIRRPSLHRHNLFGARGMYSYTAVEILLGSSHFHGNTEALFTNQDMR